MDVAIWNELHDGTITEVVGTLPGEMRVKVEIEYLCDYLPTQAKHVFVTLTDCERFEYAPYEGSVIPIPAEVAALELELLSAGEDGNDMCVECADGSYGGKLWLRYHIERTATAEGIELSQATLEYAVNLSVTEWIQRNDSAS